MAKTKGGKAGTNFWDIFKISFVASMGAIASFIVTLLLAAVFAVPGYFLVKSAKKDKKDGKNNTAKLVFGWILIVIGGIIALPFIIDILVWRGLEELT